MDEEFAESAPFVLRPIETDGKTPLRAWTIGSIRQHCPIG